MDGSRPVLADRYRLADSIGRGGMADVYSAEDTQSGHMVAVKVMRVGEAADPARFASEMQILDRLDHSAIVRLFDTGRTSDDSPYFVMQLIEGESLSVRLREEGALPEGDIVKIAARIAGALDHAHSMGVVHRDIKPANILIDDAGRGFLTDFGVARLVDATMVTRTGTTIGTAAYLAPEQLQDSSVGPAADVYSLGLVLIEAFTGRRAFRGSGVEAAMARLGRDPDLPDDLPDNWRGLLLSMTRRDPDRRPDAGFVEGVLRGNLPPPPLDPAEFAARHAVPSMSDDALTAVSGPINSDSGSGSWEPPSETSGASQRFTPPTPPPSAPTPAPPPDDGLLDAAVPQPLDGQVDRRRALLIAIAIGTIALGTLISLLLFTIGSVFGGDPEDPVTGSAPVDEATREVLRVLDASEILRATDPSLQRILRLQADDLVAAVNDDEYDVALVVANNLTTEIRSGIDRLDISDVALRPLLDALRVIIREIQVEVEGRSDDSS